MFVCYLRIGLLLNERDQQLESNWCMKVKLMNLGFGKVERKHADVKPVCLREVSFDKQVKCNYSFHRFLFEMRLLSNSSLF